MKKVLVVDDDEAIVEYICRALKKEKYTVVSATEGKAGLDKARKWHPDLLILDLMMHDIHGFDVCEALRKDKSLASMKILISTAKSYAVDQRAAMMLGANGFITKPYTAAKLVEAVRGLLGAP